MLKRIELEDYNDYEVNSRFKTSDLTDFSPFLANPSKFNLCSGKAMRSPPRSSLITRKSLHYYAKSFQVIRATKA